MTRIFKLGLTILMLHTSSTTAIDPESSWLLPTIMLNASKAESCPSLTILVAGFLWGLNWNGYYQMKYPHDNLLALPQAIQVTERSQVSSIYSRCTSTNIDPILQEFSLWYKDFGCPHLFSPNNLTFGAESNIHMQHRRPRFNETIVGSKYYQANVKDYHYTRYSLQPSRHLVVLPNIDGRLVYIDLIPPDHKVDFQHMWVDKINSLINSQFRMIRGRLEEELRSCKNERPLSFETTRLDQEAKFTANVFAPRKTIIATPAVGRIPESEEALLKMGQQ